MIKCNNCGENLLFDSETDFLSLTQYRQIFWGSNVDSRYKPFCSERCYNLYWDKYSILTDSGAVIYRVPRLHDGEMIMAYIPYINCPYWFVLQEDCERRVADKAITFHF